MGNFTNLQGSHWQGPLLGSARAAGGLCENLPGEIVSRREFVYWFNDFIATDDWDSTAWTNTNIGAGTAATVSIVADGDLGTLLVNAGTAASEGITTAFTGTGPAGEFVDLAVPINLTGNAGQQVFAFEVRCKVDLVTSGFALVGLTDSDTSPLTAATGAEAIANGAYFRFVDGGTIVGRVETGNTGTSTSVTINAVNNTYIRLGMRWITAEAVSGVASGGVGVYVNGRLVETLSGATVPRVGICPTFAALNDAGGANIDLTVDYMWIAYQRSGTDNS